MSDDKQLQQDSSSLDSSLDLTDEASSFEDVTGLKNKNAELLNEKKQWQSKYRELETQFQSIVGILGTTNPEALQEFKSSVEQERQKRIDAEKERSQIESQVTSRYQSQILELSQQISEKDRLIQQKAQSDALQSLFKSNAGEEYESFSALLSTKYKVEYEEYGTDLSGLPQYRVKAILQRNGDPIFYDGKEAKPEEFLLKARQGEYGSVLSATFTPWNQSNGGILPKGVTGSNGVIRYPRSQKATMLAKDFDGSFERKIRNGEIEFYNG